MYLEASEIALSGIKRSIFHKQKARLFCSTKLTNSLKVKCLFRNANNSVSRSSHRFSSKWSHTSIINNGWPEPDPSSILLMRYSNWRTMAGGDPAFDPLIWSIKVAWHLLVNITLEKSIFLYFLTYFNLLDFCLRLRGGLVLHGGNKSLEIILAYYKL